MSSTFIKFCKLLVNRKPYTAIQIFYILRLLPESTGFFQIHPLEIPIFQSLFIPKNLFKVFSKEALRRSI